MGALAKLLFSGIGYAKRTVAELLERQALFRELWQRSTSAQEAAQAA